MKQRTLRERYGWLLTPIMLAALAWTVWLLWGSLPALRENLPKLQRGWLLWVLIGSLISAYFAFEGFRVLFERLHPAVYGRRSLGHLYFTAQLMKHLPGRVWGVAYQSASGSRATLADWVGITAVHMLLMTGFALWAAATVLAFAYSQIVVVAVVATGAALYIWAWRARPLLALLGTIRKIRIRGLVKLCDALQPFANVDGRFKREVFAWFALSWLLYLLAWAGYGKAWPGLDAMDGIWLCAIYTVAWFAGYVSFLTPSGLGVRELVFVLLAQQFPVDAVAVLAILGRVMLLAVDVILGGVYAPFGRFRRE